ncbi:hypothetical protein OIV56_13555 [Burkholderia pseudomallei]|uniref:hypothetical protein n=1 Tax=Burkholderia pseudomallei TaxID=28450 RepID=UPI000F04C5DB|nr:hypothetical protein [Burkholderia pseudomallei]MCW0163753.1 hypothetical protein [Burkholderia pseudomallei]VBG63446.1 Uncharacterised protein [Burkholderia pseudomallei]
MSLIVLSHLIQLAALSGVGTLNLIFAAVLAGTVALFDGAAAGLSVFHARVDVLAMLARHPWAIGRAAWVVALLVALGGAWLHEKRTAR